MTPNTELAIDILTLLEQGGHLQRSSRPAMHVLLPQVEEVIRKRTAERRKVLADYFLWWARLAHAEHKPALAEAEFWLCEHPMCESLARTIQELSRETELAAPTAPTSETPSLP